MTDEMKFAIEVGMRVMVKVAAREIPATVIEVGDAYFLVRSETSGKEFRTSRVVDILDQPDAADITEEAEAIREEQEAAEELRRREENEINPPPFTMPGADVNEATADDNQNKENDTMQEEMKEDAVAVNTQDAIEENAIEVEDKPIAEETADVQYPAEPSVDTESAEQPTEEAEAAPAEQPAEEVEAAPAEKPKKNLSLVDAAVEVLKAEKRPMNVKEMVKLAVERGLWIPTKCRTPEQSLYGGLYLDMKNSATPRVKKSAEKGKFELA